MSEIPQNAQVSRPREDESLQEPVSSLSVELTRISAEIQSINSGFQMQLQQAIADVQAAMEERYTARVQRAIFEIRAKLEKELREQIRKEFKCELDKYQAHVQEVRFEIERVTAQIEAVGKEIKQMIDDPQIALGQLMKKRTEQAELAAYLRGLHFFDIFS